MKLPMFCTSYQHYRPNLDHRYPFPFLLHLSMEKLDILTEIWMRKEKKHWEKKGKGSEEVET